MSAYLPYRRLSMLAKVSASALAVAVLLLVVNARPSLADITIAEDSFDDGDGFSGGTGWVNNWVIDSPVSVSSQSGPKHGSHHLRVRGGGHATRKVDLTGEENVHLTFWAKTRDLAGSTAYIQVSANGSSFQTLVSWGQNSPNANDDVYRFYDFNLSSLDLNTSGPLWVRLRVNGNYEADLFVDSLKIVNTGGNPDDPPGGNSVPIVLDGKFSDWAGKAHITDAYNDNSNSSRYDIAAFYWANNVDEKVNFHMIQRHTTNGQPFNGNNGQSSTTTYIIYVDTNNNGSFNNSVDRRIQVTYTPKHNSSEVRVVVRSATSSNKISDTGWRDWGESRSEGGLRFEFPVKWKDLGTQFGSVVRMYAVSYSDGYSSPDIEDRVPNSGNVQWSPASVLGPWLLAGAMVLGIVVIWYFKGRRQWT